MKKKKKIQFSGEVKPSLSLLPLRNGALGW